MTPAGCHTDAQLQASPVAPCCTYDHIMVASYPTHVCLLALLLLLLTRRQWELIWGGVLMVFAFVPTFRHFRILNIIALVGTTYTSIMILVMAHNNGYFPNKVKL